MASLTSPIEYLVNEGSSIIMVIRAWLPTKECADRNNVSYMVTQEDVLAECESLSMNQYPVVMFGNTVMQPRLNYGCGDPGIESHKYAGLDLALLPWTPAAKMVRDRIVEETQIPLNACLTNKYRDGNDYIGEHRDKEALGIGNTVVTVSIGASRLFTATRCSDNFKYQTMLHQGDACIMVGDTQNTHKHGVKKDPKITGARYALTYRFIVPRK